MGRGRGRWDAESDDEEEPAAPPAQRPRLAEEAPVLAEPRPQAGGSWVGLGDASTTAMREVEEFRARLRAEAAEAEAAEQPAPVRRRQPHEMLLSPSRSGSSEADEPPSAAVEAMAAERDAAAALPPPAAPSPLPPPAEEDEPEAEESEPLRAFDPRQSCRSVELFQRLNHIDEGTYGVVFRARERATGRVVALKKVKMEKEKEGFPLTSLREMNLLLRLRHPNIVNVTEVVVGSSLDSVYMVMEFMPHDLKVLLDEQRTPFTVSEVKCLACQLLAGCAYLHANWVLHRDLKTSNVLVNNRGELKLCDFGMARCYGSPLRAYTHMVVTLWYRPPELLLGCLQYSTAVDVWSLGCILGELLGRKPLMEGRSEIDQLNQQFKLLGPPTEAAWPGLSELPIVKKIRLPPPAPSQLRARFPARTTDGRPALSELGLELMSSMLAWDPSRRISCEQALSHPWFSEVPLPKDKALMPTRPPLNDAPRRELDRDPLVEQARRETLQRQMGRGQGGLFRQ